MLEGAAVLVAAYLVGSVPSAYLVTRLVSRVDVRQVGSGNVGGMNVLRNVGFLAGLAVAGIDVGKGALAVHVAALSSSLALAPMLAALGVVAGHNWMAFLRFRGGKGLGATAGALAVISPLALLLWIGAMALGVLLLRDANCGAAAGTLLLPGIFWVSGAAPACIGLSALLAIAVVLKHRPDFSAYRRGRCRLV